MTDATKTELLGKIKLLLDIEDSSTKTDQLLLLLIEQAAEEAVNYTHNSDVSELSGCICQMVCYLYNLRGTEGITSESYSSVEFNYATEYPQCIMNSLKAKRKVVMM